MGKGQPSNIARKDLAASGAESKAGVTAKDQAMDKNPKSGDEVGQPRRFVALTAIVIFDLAAALLATRLLLPPSEWSGALNAAMIILISLAVLISGPVFFGEVRLRTAESKSPFWRSLEWLRSTFAGEPPSYCNRS